MLHSLLGAAAVTALALSASEARARQEYYDAIAAQTGTCADCRLCHQGPVGSLETLVIDPAIKPFANHWYVGGQPLPLPADNYDSDMDGVSDVAELMGDGMGGGYGDPNDPMVGLGQFECPTGPTPGFGCARIAPRVPKGDGWALVISLLPALLLLRRRR